MPRHRLTYKYKFQSPPTCRGKIPPPQPPPVPSGCPILISPSQCTWETQTDYRRNILGHPANLIDKQFALGCGLLATGYQPETLTINCYLSSEIPPGQFYFGVYINSAFCGAPPKTFDLAAFFSDGTTYDVIDYFSDSSPMPVNQWIIGHQASKFSLVKVQLFIQTYNLASTIISQIFIARCVPFSL
jgi:hypothetical protein